jgi:hypothetical protein
VRQLGETIGHLAQRVRGGDRRVLVQLDDIEPADTDVEARRLVKTGVGVEDTAQQRFHRGRDRQARRRVVAEQQRRQRQLAILLAEHVDYLQQVAQDAGAYSLGQLVDAQVALVGAETANDGTAEAAAAAFLFVGNAQDHRRRAAGTGVEPEVVALAEVTVEQFAVDQRLGAGNRVLLVVPEQHRLRQETQVHRLDADREPALRARHHAAAWRPAQQAARHRLAAIECRRPGVVNQRQRGLAAAHRRRTAQQSGRRSGMQQFTEGREILAGRRQVAVPDRHVIVVADILDSPGCPGDGAVALRRADQAQALLLLTHAAGGIARNTEDVDGLRRPGHRQRRRRILVVLPEPIRGVELALRRRRRLVVAEPDVEDHLLVPLPCVGGLKILVCLAATGFPREAVDKPRSRQQLQGAGKTGNDREYLPQAVVDVEARQRTQRVALAEQVLDHRVAALIGCPEHHEARPVTRHQCLQHRRPCVPAGTNDQSAGTVGKQTNRLIRLLQQAVEESGEPFAENVERLPPVVGEALDAVAARQEIAKVGVEHAEESLGLDARLPPGDPRQAAAGNVERVEPDAVLAVHPEVRAHQARQDDDDRQVGRRRGTPGGRATRGRRVDQSVAIREGAGQGLESRQPQDVADDQPVAQRGARVDIGEVAEMRDVGTAIEQCARARLRRNAGEHRRRVDDEVVIDAVEEQEIRQQDAEALEQVAAFDVAGDHRHLESGTHRRVAQQPHHRRVGQHRFDSRHQMGIGALARDLENHPFERGIDRTAEKERHLADQRQQTGEEEVQIAARQLRPLRRAGDPHVALHDDLASGQIGGQLPQLRALSGVSGVELAPDALPVLFVGIAGAGQIGSVTVDQRVEALQAEQVSDKTAARMRDETDPDAVRQRRQQLQRIFDRALRQRAVLEGVDTAGEIPLERAPQVALIELQVAEAAERARAHPVDEDQHRQFRARRLLQVGARPRQLPLRLRLCILAGNARTAPLRTSSQP